MVLRNNSKNQCEELTLEHWSASPDALVLQPRIQSNRPRSCPDEPQAVVLISAGRTKVVYSIEKKIVTRVVFPVVVLMIQFI